MNTYWDSFDCEIQSDELAMVDWDSLMEEIYNEEAKQE